MEDHAEAAELENKLFRRKMILLDTEQTQAVSKVEVWKKSSCGEWKTQDSGEGVKPFLLSFQQES